MGTYWILGQEVDTDDPALQAALAAAHAARRRPLCLCMPDCSEPPEMYVAKVAGSYVIKRMPFTGGRHAAACASYEPPEGWSGLGQVMGSAIQEDPATGVTALKLEFPLSKTGSRTIEPGCGAGGDSVRSDGTRLTLRGLLHYLWDEAELTHWKPAFAGRRTWSTVRRHLLGAAAGKVVRGQSLLDRMYVPEPFNTEYRDAICARRRARWAEATAASKGSRPLMLLIGEVKEIVPARFGCRSVIKHVPDQPFALDDGLYRRLGRRFAEELAMWGALEDVRMIVAGTFGVNGAGVPAFEELTLMAVTAQWLPVESEAAAALLRRLVTDERAFRKTLRYNLAADQALAAALLTDVGDEPVALHIDSSLDAAEPNEGDVESAERVAEPACWRWRPGAGPMPALPGRAQRMHVERAA